MLNHPDFRVIDIPGFDPATNITYTFNNSITPFDAIWADGNNDSHVAFEGANFMMSEISPATLFVQDKVVLSGDAKIYEARERVRLGRNITDAFPVGDVVFRAGSEVLVRAGTEIIQEVEGFEVEVGAEVEFRIEFYECQ